MRVLLCSLALLFCIVSCSVAQEFVTISNLGPTSSWDNPAIWVDQVAPGANSGARVIVNASCDILCTLTLPDAGFSISFLHLNSNIKLVGVQNAMYNVTEYFSWFRGTLDGGTWNVYATGIGKIGSAVLPNLVWTITDATHLSVQTETLLRDGTSLSLPGGMDTSTIALESGTAKAQISGPGSITIQNGVTIPDSAVLKSYTSEPNLAIDVLNSFAARGTNWTVGSNTHLRLSTSGSIWFDNAAVHVVITVSKLNARFQLLSSDWLSGLPYFIVKTVPNSELTNPMFTFGSPTNFGSSCKLVVDGLDFSNSKIDQLYWDIYGELYFQNNVYSSMSVRLAAAVFRSGSKLNAVDGNTLSKFPIIHVSYLFFAASAANPANISNVVVNVTTSMFDYNPGFGEPETSGLILARGVLTIAAGAVANFTKPMTMTSGYRCDVQYCGFINYGSTYFYQRTVAADVTHRINVLHDNEGQFFFKGQAGTNAGAVVSFGALNALPAAAAPKGGTWMVDHYDSDGPSIIFATNKGPYDPSNSYLFANSTNFHGNGVNQYAIQFLNGDYYFASKQITSLARTMWKNAALVIEPGTGFTLSEMIGTNWGCYQFPVATPTSRVILRDSSLDFSTSYGSPNFNLDVLELQNNVIFTDVKIKYPPWYQISLKLSMGSNVAINGNFFKSAADTTKATSLRIIIDGGALLNTTNAIATTDPEITNGGLLRILSSSLNTSQPLNFTKRFEQSATAALVLSDAYPQPPITSVNDLPARGQYLLLLDSNSKLEGSVGVQDPFLSYSLAAGDYYLARIKTSTRQLSLDQTFVSLEPGGSASLQSVPLSSNSLDWITMTITAPPPVEVPSPANVAPNSANNQAGGAGVIGVAVGVPVALVLLGVLIAVVIILIRRKKKKKKNNNNNGAENGAGKKTKEAEMDANGNYGAIGASGGKGKKNGTNDDDGEGGEHYGAISSGPALARTESGIDKSKNALKTKNLEWQIPFEELTFQQELGSGAFGSVWKGKWNGTDCAIKQSLLVSASAAQAADFELEAKLMTKLRPHPNVCQILGISVTQDRMLLVMEYCKRGSLTSYFGKEKLELNRKLRLISGLAQGINHLHKNRIIHRDIAARNVLVTTDWTGKISDFGLSRLIGNEKSGTTASNIGPVRWMSPEAIKSKEYSPASDAWSFGIAVWEIFAEKEPHVELDLLDAAIKIRDEKLTPPLPDSMPDGVKEVCRRCWAVDPEERPSFDQIVKDIADIIGEDSESSSSSE